jgi:Tfp pilus assembly protein PilF
MKSETGAAATFITFYSFKGGVGRSMALINTAGILAGHRGFRVLVLDLDLEAPGLTYLDPESPDATKVQRQGELPLQLGFVDLITDALERGEAADLFTLSPTDLDAKYTRKIKIPDQLRDFPDGTLHIMPAGRFDHDYASRLDALNLNELYRKGLGEPLIRAFKKRLAESGSYDYVLVDSRTGISEGAGICTRDLADHVMLLSGLNRQNVEGTTEFLREFRTATDGKRKIQIILSPMPNGEDELLDRRRDAAQDRFGSAWGSGIDLSLEIPYHPQLALTEEPHIFRRRRGYLFEAYRRIEASMLNELGHDGPTFRRRVMKSLEEKRYPAALRALDHMIRLDGGQGSLSRLLDDLAVGRPPQRSAGREPLEGAINFEKLLTDEGGRPVVEFIVEKLSVGDRDSTSRRLLQELDKKSPDLAHKFVRRIFDALAHNADRLSDYAQFLDWAAKPDVAELFFKGAVEADQKDAKHLSNYARFLTEQGRFEEAEVLYKRAIESDPKDPRHLGNYAIFLEQRERLHEAGATYERAIEADPQLAMNLGNYALFLHKQERFDEAEAFHKRAIESDPKDSRHLGNYAIFLEDRQRFEQAEAFYKRAVEMDPKQVNLGNYALFLHKRQRFAEAEVFYRRSIETDSTDARFYGNYAIFLEDRERFNEAETVYRRGVELDPNNDVCLGNYAVFLQRRQRFDEAEVLFKRAIQAAPEQARHLGNYGQFLLGSGRFAEGEAKLLQAFEHAGSLLRGEQAELCLAVWLAFRVQGRDGTGWERRFKFFIEGGFKRYRWNFDRILQQAEKLVSAEELNYAKTLANAFVKESKVADLANSSRWQRLEPLNSKCEV